MNLESFGYKTNAQPTELIESTIRARSAALTSNEAQRVEGLLGYTVTGLQVFFNPIGILEQRTILQPKLAKIQEKILAECIFVYTVSMKKQKMAMIVFELLIEFCFFRTPCTTLYFE